MSGAGVDRAAAAAAATPHAWHTSYSLRIPPSEVIVIDDDSCEPESDRARQHHTATATATTTAAAATPATIKPADLLAPPRSSYDDASLVRATASANTHCASPHFLGHGAHQIYKDTAASATVALNAAAASSASAPNSLASTALNSQSSSLLPAVDVNAAVSSSSAIPAKDSDSSPHQPRYMTRSVAQNAAKRKQEELFPDNLELQGVHSGGPADASAFHPPLPTASSRRRVSQEYAALAAVSQVNPYSMMLSCNQQAQQQQSVTWTSSVLYQAARAVAAAAAGSSLTGAAAPASRSTRQKATATTASQQQPPAPKRRKNAAASNVATKPAAAAPRAARARAAPRAKQQPQQKAEPSCDDRDGHYIVVPGRDFTQRFKIRRLLGQGTFGKVMECEDAATGRLVAIKVIRAVSKYRDAAKIEIRVLQTLQRNDPTNVFQCMHVNETFDHRNHVCMVFDLLGPSVFDFLKENEFRPFSLHHVQLFAEQLLRSVAFLHSLNLVHTDLKPENILLESGEYDVVPFGSSHTVKTRMLKSTNIRLIDFGSATFNNEYHSQVVSTRHYRAPEIILNLGWSFPCDMWSIGCIILELLTGEALFQTHDNNEHLAMMEVVVGQAPAHIVRSVAPDLRPKFFRSDGTARYPAPDQPRQSQKGLRAMRPLDQLVNPATNPIYANLHDLLYRLLQYDPRARITAKEACDHQFFRHRVGPDGRLANRPPPTPQHQQHSQAPAQQQQQQILASAADMAHYSAAHQQRLHRPSFPSASAAMPQLPAAAAVAAPSVNSYTFPSGVARAPLRVADYSISAANGTQRHSALQHHHLAPSTPKAALASQLHAAAQPSGYYYREQGNISSHLAYQQDYVNRLPPPPPPHYQQQAPPQLQLHSRAHADAYPWHYASSASMAAVHTPTLPSGAMPTGYEAHSSVDMATSQPRSSSKRKAGAPIDSGYFPDIAGSVADSLHNGHSSPVAGGPLGNGGGGVPRPLPRNYSSGSLFTTAPLPGSMASPGCYAAAGNNSKACNLPPLAPHAATQPIAVAGSGVSLPLHHQYHQQRQLLGNHPSSGAMGGASGIARVPIDANATPTLTIASTATPTPGSTSTQLGNGAAHHIEGNMAAGTHKLAGRSLPSLALGNGMARAGMMDATQQQQQHAGYYYRQNMAPQMPHRSPQPASPMAHQQQQQQALAHASRGGGYYANPPPPHTLLQPPPPQQAPSGPAHMDYAHHSHQFASPSSTQHPNYY